VAPALDIGQSFSAWSKSSVDHVICRRAEGPVSSRGMSKEEARLPNYGTDFEWLVETLFQRYASGSKSKSRIVCVVGAGSSVWSGLTTWNERFKNDLLDAAAAKFPGFVDECWRVLSGVIGLPPEGQDPERRKKLVKLASIEDIASVAVRSSIVGDEIYELLNTRFTPLDAQKSSGLQPPQLGYELIAHFLKHGFADHAITFNFDELLDDAIDNELGRNEFTLVASEHDVSTRTPRLEPHLIKLHGTLSRPATLRFTRRSTSSLHPSLVRLLDRIVLGRTRDGASRDQLDTHIVSLGYAWRDLDFRHWFEARQQLIKGVIVVVRGSKEIKRLQQVFASELQRTKSVRFIDLERLCRNFGESRRTVDTLLWATWSALETKMLQKETKTPFMPAARHILLSQLFSPKGLHKPSLRINEPESLSRFVVEFVLHLAKCKGMVNVSTMANDDRIRRYYNFVKETHGRKARRANLDLLSYVTASGFLRTGQSKLPTISRSSYPDVRETYYAVADTPAKLALPLLNDNDFAIGALHQPIYISAKRGIVEDGGGDGRAFVENQIRAIFNGPEIEITRRPADRNSWTLKSAVPILTYIDLQNRTKEVLRANWNQLFVIAESGQWMADEQVKTLICKRPGRQIFLIEAKQPETEWPLRHLIDRDLTQAWTDYGSAGIDVSRAALSWWEHNRHMTLAVSRDGKRAKCEGGIFFRRRHKKSRIQPLFVNASDADDVAELILTFLAYLRRAAEEQKSAQPRMSINPLLIQQCCETALALRTSPSARQRIVRLVEQLKAVA
jgi:hypothetical protein